MENKAAPCTRYNREHNVDLDFSTLKIKYQGINYFLLYITPFKFQRSIFISSDKQHF